jgi:hypothetical protein
MSLQQTARAMRDFSLAMSLRHGCGSAPYERQIRFDLLLSFTQVIVRLHVEMKDKALHPFTVASLRANRIVSPSHHITHIIKNLI